MSKVSGPHGFTTFPHLPTVTWACLESSMKLTTWLGAGGSIESVNYLWTANIYSPHISNGYIASYSTYNYVITRYFNFPDQHENASSRPVFL